MMMVSDLKGQPGGEQGSVDGDTEFVYRLNRTNELLNELKQDKDTMKWSTKNISSFTKPCILTNSLVT